MTESICGDFVAYLKAHHRGRKKAVTSRRLEAVFNIKGSEVRKIVNEVKSTGHPVCSDNSGYYYAANEKELTRQSRSYPGVFVIFQTQEAFSFRLLANRNHYVGGMNL